MKKIFTDIFFKKSTSGKIDRLFLLATVLLSAYGTLMVFSAGGPYAEARYGDSTYFIKRQALWLIIGFVAAYIASRIDLQIFKKCSVASK